MTRLARKASTLSLLLATSALGAEDAPRPARAQGSPGFVNDVAPILSKHCVGCHNARKSEGRYDLTTFAKLAKGAQGGEVAVTPGDPVNSRLIEVIRPDAEPRMPHKQAPLAAEKVAILQQWVAEGAKLDGIGPDEDWVTVVHKRTPVAIPDSYGSPVPIPALAFRPDGRAILTSGYHEVISWDTSDGKPGRRLQGLPERVQAIAYSPDGRWLAVAGGDPGLLGSARLWRVAPGDLERPRDLIEGPDVFLALAFSPDSKLVAVGGVDRAVRIWEVESGELVTTIEDHADWVQGLAFSPNGKRIATASRDKTSKVFDARTKESIVAFAGHAETVYSVAFSPDGKFVATGGGDNQVRVWSPEDGKPARSFGGFGGAVLKVLYTPDGRDLVASSADGTVRTFREDQRRLELRGHGDWVNSLAISTDGRRLASGSWDGEVHFWELEDGSASFAFRAAPGFNRLPVTTSNLNK